MDNNEVVIAGFINASLELDHQLYGEKFYKFYMGIPRLSGYIDLLPVTISDRLIGLNGLKRGDEIVVKGQLRSYNKLIEGKNRLILTVFARDIVSGENEKVKNPNHIFLNGFLCKTPIYRVTPFKREIADILLAVNRSYNKSDYIPAIAWGRNARFCETLDVGDQLMIWGRIQSRIYQKRLEDGDMEERTAYEVSITKMEIAVKK
ncbi:MAG: single-stranded DNA-binding protein [Clostridiales bacterium]|nr:single-stranded DNA-binding protein [Clostridiales bacterium]